MGAVEQEETGAALQDCHGPAAPPAPARQPAAAQLTVLPQCGVKGGVGGDQQGGGEAGVLQQLLQGGLGGIQGLPAGKRRGEGEMRRRKSRQCCSDVGNRLGSTRAANAAERNKCSGLQRRQRRGHLEEACGSQLLQHVVGGLAAAAAGAGHLAEALGRQLSVGVKPARAAWEWQAGLGRVEAHPVAFACSSHTPQPRPPQTPPPPPPLTCRPRRTCQRSAGRSSRR